MLALRPVLGALDFFVRAPTAVETLIGPNYLECNGVAVSRTTYESLYDMLNTMRAAHGTGTQTLNGALTISQTTITLNSPYPAGWPYPVNAPGSSTCPYAFTMPFLIQIESEKMLVTSMGAAPYLTLTVVRAREGTAAATHASGSAVSVVPDMPFGSGDGATTFNLPDLHGRQPWSAARAGGHTDVTAIGKDDNVVLAARRPKHRHGVKVRTASAQGNQAPLTSGTDTGYSERGGDQYGWGWASYGLYAGPFDEAGAAAAWSTTPLNAPAHVVAGVWGIRFVGV